MQDKEQQKKPPSILQVAFSVIAAAFGVQSSKNSKRDFTTGKPLVFVLAGLLFTLLFVMAIVAVVNLVIKG